MQDAHFRPFYFPQERRKTFVLLWKIHTLRGKTLFLVWRLHRQLKITPYYIKLLQGKQNGTVNKSYE